MTLKLSLIAAALIVLGLGLYEYGHIRYVAGEAVVQDQWDAQKGRDAVALAADLIKKQKDAESYAKQITDANDARDLIRAQLLRIRAAPVPHLMCHAAAPDNSGAVSGVPAAAAPGPAGTGTLPQTIDFDPSERLFAEVADPADNAVESCRHLWDIWPVPSEPAVPSAPP